MKTMTLFKNHIAALVVATVLAMPAASAAETPADTGFRTPLSPLMRNNPEIQFPWRQPKA